MSVPVLMPYVSNGTFLRVPHWASGSATSAAFGVVGLPWDSSVTNRPGARFGPSGVRAASLMLCDGIHPHFDVTPVPHTVDVGDLELPNTSLERMRAALERQLVDIIPAFQRVLFLGGDHSVTLSILRAYRQHLGRPLACIHFDAHCDTWRDHFGEPSGHGTWVHEAIVERVIDPVLTFQIGIRSSADRDAREYVTREGGMVFTGRQLRSLHRECELRADVIEPILKRLAQHGNPPVYITFDIDALDPSCAPGTGTPEVGGLTTSQALTLVESFCAEVPRIIGMDVVEVAPAYDVSQLTTYAAATLGWTFLSAQAAQLKSTPK